MSLEQKRKARFEILKQRCTDDPVFNMVTMTQAQILSSGIEFETLEAALWLSRYVKLPEPQPIQEPNQLVMADNGEILMPEKKLVLV